MNVNNEKPWYDWRDLGVELRTQDGENWFVRIIDGQGNESWWPSAGPRTISSGRAGDFVALMYKFSATFEATADPGAFTIPGTVIVTSDATHINDVLVATPDTEAGR